MTGDGASACVFCQIIGRRAPPHIVDEDDLSLALLDINPLTEGHTLVIPKRHVEWWHDMTDDETASVFRLARRVALRLGEVFSPEFVCMYARGRRIPHTHVFLVPTQKGDLLDAFFNALERMQESSSKLASLKTNDGLAVTAEKLRQR